MGLGCECEGCGAMGCFVGWSWEGVGRANVTDESWWVSEGSSAEVYSFLFFS